MLNVLPKCESKTVWSKLDIKNNYIAKLLNSFLYVFKQFQTRNELTDCKSKKYIYYFYCQIFLIQIYFAESSGVLNIIYFIGTNY